MKHCRAPLYVVIVFLYGLLGLPAQGVSQDIQFELVPRPTDDFAGAISHIVQDKQGFLWLATQQGLFKYDGQTFFNYSHQPQNANTPADFTIWGMMVDRKGILWLQPGGYGLDRFDPVTEIFTHYRHNDKDSTSVAHDEVTAVFEDRDGIIWVGTTAGLDKFDQTTKTFSHYKHNPDDSTTISCNEVRVIYEDRQGTIWVGTGNPYADPWTKNPRGGLNRFDKHTGKFIRYEHNKNDVNSLVDNRVQVIFEDSRGTFWIGTPGDGLHTMDRKTGKFQRHSYDPANPTHLSRPPVRNRVDYVPDYITFIIEDASGRIWIGSYEAAIIVYNPATNTGKYYDAHDDNNGTSNIVGYLAAEKTSDNTIWVSTIQNELYKVKPRQSIVPHINIHKEVVSLAEDEKDNLWMGTRWGIVKKSTTGKLETFHFNKDTTSLANAISSMLIEKDHMWATSYQGLHSVDLNTMEFSTMRPSLENKNSIASDEINFVRKAGANRLWIGSNSKGLDLLNVKTKTFQHFSHNQSDSTTISNNRMLSIVKDKNQNTWIGTFLGLNRFDSTTQSFKRYLNPLAIISLFEDHSGQLWCGTDAGLFKYDVGKDHFFKFTEKSALISPTLVMGSIAEDRNNNLWFATPQKGIVRLNAKRDIAIAYGENQGVARQALYSQGIITKTGELIVGDTSGYYIIKANKNSSPGPVIHLDKFLINDSTVLPGSSKILPLPLNETKEIHLNHDQNTFSFEFTDIDFISEPEETRLLYQLENYNNDWRRAKKERTAYYFDLPAGKYVFRVKGINVDGIEAEKEISIIIHPPWWKTWWAYGMFSVIGGSLAYALYRNRINQLKEKQAEQLSLMVATQEGERKRISRDLHDDVGTKLSALKLSLSALKAEATVAHNPELNSLAENSEQFITEVMQDVRQLLLNLSPTVLEEFGYTTAIEALVNKINETKQIHFNLVIFGWDTVIKKDYELALYRITQELINNVIRHAEATNVSLQVGQRDAKIILMIEDDGKGFAVTSHKEGYGLRNLEARTKLMKGTMTIDSQPGKGTSVLIEIPYNFK